MQRKHTKYLDLWNACNLRCNFCYNDLKREEKTYFRDIISVLKDVQKIRNDNNSITIVWWEPFMYPDILKVLAFVKKLDFKNIWITTNGTKLADMSFLLKIYKLWINSLEFSIHANSEELENTITSRPGKNLLKREAWIKNVLILNKKFDKKINIYSNTVINTTNYKEIINIIKYIRDLWIKDISVSFMYNLKWLSEKNKNILVKYSDVINILNKSEEKFKDINLEIDWLPYCLHKQIKNKTYKIREEESCKRQKKDYKYIDSKIDFKVKLKQCNNCSKYWKLCNWVFKDYLDIFWDSEFSSL